MRSSAKQPLSLRLAALVFLGAGIVAMVVPLGVSLQAAPRLFDVPYETMLIFGGLLWAITGIGILYKRVFWSYVAAWLIGLPCGQTLAEMVLRYWPLSPQPWDGAFAINLLGVGFLGWLLWAVTNPGARLYLRHKARPSASSQPLAFLDRR
jgi:hypothetical protein